jgi:membrane protein DedA with SNARE-associated domain
MNEITQSLIAHGGPILFAVVLVEQAGLPLPSVPWLLAAGALSASGKINAAFAVGISVAACVLADSLWFYLGRRGGNRVVHFLCRLFPPANSFVGRTKDLFAGHGPQGLIVAKFLPGLGTLMPALAGALGINAAQFLLFDSLGSFLYGTFYILGGFFFHSQLQELLAVLKDLGFGSLLFCLTLVLAFIVLKHVRRGPPFIERTGHKITECPEAGIYMI